MPTRVRALLSANARTHAPIHLHEHVDANAPLHTCLPVRSHARVLVHDACARACAGARTRLVTLADTSTHSCSAWTPRLITRTRTRDSAHSRHRTYARSAALWLLLACSARRAAKAEGFLTYSLRWSRADVCGCSGSSSARPTRKCCGARSTRRRRASRAVARRSACRGGAGLRAARWSRCAARLRALRRNSLQHRIAHVRRHPA